jgi:putative ABC transport system substrate-binding protein
LIKPLRSAAAAWPLVVRAQQPTKPHRIAIVHPAVSIAEMNERADEPYYPAFSKELRRLGYIEGENLVVARYSGEGQEERFSELCREAVQTKPDVIVATSARLTLALKAATDTIPIIASMTDPVAFGIVTSISRPGGNITGVSVEAGLEIWGKRLQLLHEAVPSASKIGFLGSRSAWRMPQVSALREAAQQLQISLHGPPLESPQQQEYRRVFAAMELQHVDALIIGDQADNRVHGRLIREWANNARLPAVFPYREDFAIGALMAYGPSLTDTYRRLASYVDQVLKGAHPGELPVYLASQFDLVINLSTARPLGLAIPPSLLVRADEVIE